MIDIFNILISKIVSLQNCFYD